MPKLKRGQIAEEIEAILETGGTVIRSSINRHINLGGRRVWYSRKWEERKRTYGFQTFAALEVEGCTVTADSKTITNAAATFVTDGVLAGDKVATGVGQPYVEIATVVSETELTLKYEWLQESSSDQDVTIYRDEYTMPSSLQAVRKIKAIRASNQGQPWPVSPGDIEDIAYIPTRAGPPESYAEIEEVEGSDTVRVRIYPVPDEKYQMVVSYWAHWTELTDDNDTHGLSVERESLLLDATLLWSQRLVTDTRPKFITEVEVEEKIRIAYENHKSSPAKSVQRTTGDHRHGTRRGLDWSQV